MIRTSIAGVFLILYILVAGPLFILHCLLTRSPEMLFRVGITGARWAMTICGIRVEREGVANIPPGACIFVGNHSSNLDPPAVVSAIPRRVALLAKKEVFNFPIVGRALRLADMVPVDRSNPDAAKASVEEALEHLRQGVSYLIFPEGTRSPDGRLRPFKKGSFLMAIRAGVPIVPISVVGASRLLQKGTYSIQPGTVTVKFHPAMATTDYSLEQKDDLIAKVQAAVASGLPEEQQPGS